MDGEDMDDMSLYYERDRKRRIVFEDNQVGRYDEKAQIHAKRRYL